MEEKFGHHCIVEIMGRLRLAGFVTEQVIAGQGFIRVDVPAVAGREAFTRLFGTGSIYCITPVTEEVAKGMAERLHAPPIEVWELPKLSRPSTDPGPGTYADAGDLAGDGVDDDD